MNFTETTICLIWIFLIFVLPVLGVIGIIIAHFTRRSNESSDAILYNDDDWEYDKDKAEKGEY